MNADQTPRQRFGWTVPGHVTVGQVVAGRQQFICAQDQRWIEIYTNGTNAGDAEFEYRVQSEIGAEARASLGDWLRCHAHGSSVEYQPAEPETASERPDAGRETAEVDRSYDGLEIYSDGTAEGKVRSLVDTLRACMTQRDEAESRADAANRRASSWWEAAKEFARDMRRARKAIDRQVLDVANAMARNAEFRARADAAEAKLAVRTEHFEGELSAALAQLKQVSADLRAVQSQRDDAQRAGLRIAEQRDEAIEMVKTCTGHPDRANPDVPSHPELIQQANAERDEARAKLAEVRAVLDSLGFYPSDHRAFEEIRAIVERPAAAPGERDQGGEYPCTSCGTTGWDCLTAMNASPVDARCCADCGLNDTHSRPAAAPAEPREEPARAKTLHADYCARADNHDGDCEAPDWYPREEPAGEVQR